MLRLAVDAMQLTRLAWRREKPLTSGARGSLPTSPPPSTSGAADSTAPEPRRRGSCDLGFPSASRPAARNCAADWHDDRTRAVLAHELATYRRGDWIVHVARRAGLRRLLVPSALLDRQEASVPRKRACRGRCSAETGIGSRDYAAHLLDIVRAVQGPRRPGRRRSLWRAPSPRAALRGVAQRVCQSPRGDEMDAGCSALRHDVVALPLAALGSRRADMNIEIRTSNLPAIAPAPPPG